MKETYSQVIELLKLGMPKYKALKMLGVDRGMFRKSLTDKQKNHLLDLRYIYGYTTSSVVEPKVMQEIKNLREEVLWIQAL